MAVTAWQVHDTGLVAVLPRFRRLPGRVRHLQGRGPAWPREVELDVVDGELVVAGVGAWAIGSVRAAKVADGPPLHFTLDLGNDGAQLLATTPGPAVDALLVALGG